jgi:hypothetical protein
MSDPHVIARPLRLESRPGPGLAWGDDPSPFASSMQCSMAPFYLRRRLKEIRYAPPVKTQARKSLERYILLLRTQEVIADRHRLQPGHPIASPPFHFPGCCVSMPRSYKRRGGTSEYLHLACIAPHLTRAHHSYHDDVDDSFEQHCPRLSCLAALDGTRPLPSHDDCGFRWRGRSERGMDGAD